MRTILASVRNILREPARTSTSTSTRARAATRRPATTTRAALRSCTWTGARARSAGRAPRAARTRSRRRRRSGAGPLGRASARRYGRSFVIASNASTVKTIRAGTGIASPESRFRVASPSQRSWLARTSGARCSSPAISARISARGSCACAGPCARAGSADGPGRGSAPVPRACRCRAGSRQARARTGRPGASPSSAPTLRQSPGQPVGVIGGSAVVRPERGDQLDGRALDRRAGVRTGLLQPGRAVEQSRQRWRYRVGHAPNRVRIRANAPSTLPLLPTGRRQRPRARCQTEAPHALLLGLSAGAAFLCTIGGQQVRLDDLRAAQKADALAAQVKRRPAPSRRTT